MLIISVHEGFKMKDLNGPILKSTSMDTFGLLFKVLRKYRTYSWTCPSVKSGFVLPCLYCPTILSVWYKLWLL
jgi:hypothetical protein